jgi:hypothetical protein
VAVSTLDDFDAEEVALGGFRDWHVAVAKEELRRTGWNQWQTFTDNRFAKPIESVKLFGKIEFASEGMAEAVAFLWANLDKRARKIYDEGDYMRSMRIFVKGVGVVTGPDEVPPDAIDVSFYPLVPYARKIELGLSPKAKGGVYKPAYRAVNRVFGKSAKITFSYTVPRDADAKAVLRSNARGRDKKTGNLTGYTAPTPVPIIYLRQGGFFQ